MNNRYNCFNIYRVVKVPSEYNSLSDITICIIIIEIIWLSIYFIIHSFIFDQSDLGKKHAFD